MFRHVVLVRWRQEASEEQRQAARDALSRLPSQIPEIREMRLGGNVGSGPNHYDLALVVDFENRESWQRYLQHPAHRAYADGPGKAAVGTLAVVQHEW
jgi:hypothetical protein